MDLIIPIFFVIYKLECIGAISLAIEDVTRMKILPDDHELNFVVAETYGEEEESILQTAQLWMHNVTAYSTQHKELKKLLNTLNTLNCIKQQSDLRRRAFMKRGWQLPFAYQ